jgi:hypothetical protein
MEPLKRPREGVAQLVEAHAFHNVMVQDHIQYEVLYSAEDLKRFRAVVAPNLTVLSDGDAALLKEYVAQGGRLLVSGEAGAADEEGGPRDAPALADVAGFSKRSWAPWSYAFVRRGDSELFEGMPDVPVRIAGPVALLSGVTGGMLAEVQLPEAPNTVNTTLLWHEPAGDEDRSYPYILETRHGKGSCIYVASALCSSTTAFEGIAGGWAKELARRLLLRLLPEEERTLSVDAPPGCEVVLNRKDDQFAVSLLNHYAGHPDYLAMDGKEAAAGPFELKLRRCVQGQARAWVQPEGTLVETRAEGDTLHLTVPKFQVHQVITVAPDG